MSLTRRPGAHADRDTREVRPPVADVTSDEETIDMKTTRTDNPDDDRSPVLRP
jgi:hypothetical protein